MSNEKPKMNNRMSLCVSIFTAQDHYRQDAKAHIDTAARAQAGRRATRHGEQALPRRSRSNSGKTGTP
jgi:hypothetical protein